MICCRSRHVAALSPRGRAPVAGSAPSRPRSGPPGVARRRRGSDGGSRAHRHHRPAEPHSGSGARAWGMGGAFLARADDATAASWNPAGLSYLRLPEVSSSACGTSFHRAADEHRQQAPERPLRGQTVDFGALTWPVAIKEARGAVQLSYQRAISFDGTRTARELDPGNYALRRSDDFTSDGGFDVIALGTGFRLTAACARASRSIAGSTATARASRATSSSAGHQAATARVRDGFPAARLELQRRPDLVADRAAQRRRDLQDTVHAGCNSTSCAATTGSESPTPRPGHHEFLLE